MTRGGPLAKPALEPIGAFASGLGARLTLRGSKFSASGVSSPKLNVVASKAGFQVLQAAFEPASADFCRVGGGGFGVGATDGSGAGGALDEAGVLAGPAFSTPAFRKAATISDFSKQCLMLTRWNPARAFNFPTESFSSGSGGGTSGSGEAGGSGDANGEASPSTEGEGLGQKLVSSGEAPAVAPSATALSLSSPSSLCFLAGGSPGAALELGGAALEPGGAFDLGPAAFEDGGAPTGLEAGAPVGAPSPPNVGFMSRALLAQLPPLPKPLARKRALASVTIK